MMSKTYFLQKRNEFFHTYRWALRENGGTSFLLAALLFVFLPMILILQESAHTWYVREAESGAVLTKNIFEQYLRVAIPLFGLTLLLLFAVLFSVRLFRYLQDGRSVDLFHSLPIGRVPLLLGRWCAGVTALAVPLALNFFVLQIVAWVYGVSADGASAQAENAGYWMSSNMAVWLDRQLINVNLWQIFWVLLLVVAAAFTCCVVAMVCSGSVMDGMLSVLGINIGVPLSVFLCMMLIKLMVPGMDPFWSDMSLIFVLSPFASAYQPFATAMPFWFLPWWIFFTAISLAAACLLYRRRKSESAGSRFAFPTLKIVVRFLMTVCGGLGLGLALKDNGGGFWVGLLAGSAITHVVLEGLYSRGFGTLKKSLRWYAAFLGAFILFYGILSTGCVGYDTRIPAAAEVASVTIAPPSEISPSKLAGQSESGEEVLFQPVLKKPESIQAVVQIHKDLIGLYRSQGFPYTPRNASYDSLKLIYHFKNGKTMSRSFSDCENTESDAFRKKTNEIKQISEYWQNSDVIFFLHPNDINSITIESGRPIFPNVRTREELLEALRADYCADNMNRTDYSTGKTISIKWKQKILASGRFSEMLGGYAGSINLMQSQYFFQAGGKVDEVIQKMVGSPNAKN